MTWDIAGRARDIHGAMRRSGNPLLRMAEGGDRKAWSAAMFIVLISALQGTIRESGQAVAFIEPDGDQQRDAEAIVFDVLEKLDRILNNGAQK